MRSCRALAVCWIAVTGCYSGARTQATPAPAPAEGPPAFYLERGRKGSEPLGETAPADPQPVLRTSVVRVVPVAGKSRLKSLEITAGDRRIHSGDCTQANNCRYIGVGGTYKINIRDLEADHNEAVTIAATTVDDYTARGYLEMQRRWALSGITSPVLMRVTGTAAGFRLENFAPSIAAGLRHNFDSKGFRYASVNGLLTVYSLPDEEYALSVGGIADFSGFLQIGPTYHMKDKNWYLVLGIRPEVLFGLIPRLQPKD
jgi:hypothetical protein